MTRYVIPLAVFAGLVLSVLLGGRVSPLTRRRPAGTDRPEPGELRVTESRSTSTLRGLSPWPGLAAMATGTYGHAITGMFWLGVALMAVPVVLAVRVLAAGYGHVEGTRTRRHPDRPTATTAAPRSSARPAPSLADLANAPTAIRGRSPLPGVPGPELPELPWPPPADPAPVPARAGRHLRSVPDPQTPADLARPGQPDRCESCGRQGPTKDVPVSGLAVAGTVDGPRPALTIDVRSVRLCASCAPTAPAPAAGLPRAGA